MQLKGSKGTSKDQWIVASCFQLLTREDDANYLNTPTLIIMVTKMIENQVHGTSFCMEKHQSFGAQGRNQLWHYHHVKLSTLQHLCVLVKLCG